MKARITLFLFIIPILSIMAQPPVNNAITPFSYGEHLSFKVYYHSWITGNMTAGIATLSVADEPVKVGNKEAFHVIGEGRSKGSFSWFFKVRDRFETFIDPDSMLPLKFVRRTREGGFSKDEDYIFDHENKKVSSTRKETNITARTQDVISAFFYARTIDFSDAEPGSIYPIDFVFDDEVYTTRILYDGLDTVEIKMGKFACLRFLPLVIEGDVFKEEFPLTLWITNDHNRIPLMAESEIAIGSVRMELVDFERLANPFSSRLE